MKFQLRYFGNFASFKTISLIISTKDPRRDATSTQ